MVFLTVYLIVIQQGSGATSLYWSSGSSWVSTTHPSVLPTDDEQTAPGPNDLTAPSISGPRIVPPGVSDQPRVVPLAGSPPALTASQACRKRRADAKRSTAIVEGPQYLNHPEVEQTVGIDQSGILIWTY